MTETIKRSTVGDASPGRLALLGTATYAAVETGVLVSSTNPTSEMSLVARYVDANNYLSMTVAHGLMRVRQIVAGVGTNYILSGDMGMLANTGYLLRFVVYASGLFIATALDSAGASVVLERRGSAPALATGGVLASGRVGIIDYHQPGATTNTRYYDAFYVATPIAEPLVVSPGQSVEFRHDENPSGYRGSRFVVPTGTSRVLCKARREDITLAADANVTDVTTLRVFYQPRYVDPR